jgi:hypothetical protein
MSHTTRPASTRPYADRHDAFGQDDDRLPIPVAVPVIVALSLALWVGIGFAVSALL